MLEWLDHNFLIPLSNLIGALGLYALLILSIAYSLRAIWRLSGWITRTFFRR